MKIKIPEELISEFVGDDLEQVSGGIRPIQSVFTTVNVPAPDDESDVPQTTDVYIKHAKQPWWLTNIFGGYGVASTGSVSEGKNININERPVKEYMVGRNSRSGEIVNKEEIPSLDDLEKIYDKPLMKKHTLQFTTALQKMQSTLAKEDESGALAIALNYVLNNVDVSSIPENFKKQLRDAIK